MNPIKGKITSHFGNRKDPLTGKMKFHNGIDIACPVGTPVLAPCDGVIMDVWNDLKGGNSISMMSYEGVRFGFAHLSKQNADELDEVKAGDTIALSGNSGHVTGPHLHLTVQKNGLYIDPLKYFKIQEG